MAELYKFFSDHGTAQIVALLVLGLTFLARLSWVWSNSQTAGMEVTRGQWAQIYIYGLGCFLCFVIIFGFMTTPENAQNLIDILHFNGPLNALTRAVQKVILYVVRLAM